VVPFCRAIAKPSRRKQSSLGREPNFRPLVRNAPDGAGPGTMSRFATLLSWSSLHAPITVGIEVRAGPRRSARVLISRFSRKGFAVG